MRHRLITLFCLFCYLGCVKPSLFANAPVCGVDSFTNCTAQRDYEAAQEFVNSKRTIPLIDKNCKLYISGDARFIYANIEENFGGLDDQNLNGLLGNVPLRGEKAFAWQNNSDGTILFAKPSDAANNERIPFSNTGVAVQFNLYFDYTCDRSWAVAWLQMQNEGGIGQTGKTCKSDPEGLFGSGCFSGLCLRKAYVGYNFFANGCARLDAELGRRPIYTVFDSYVQFQSNFDGLLFKYAHKVPRYGDFYWYTGAFVVDERVNNYAWITEVGLLALCDLGFDIRYSFIDWASFSNRSRCTVELLKTIEFAEDLKFPTLGSQFRVSQLTLSYGTTLPYLCKSFKAYGAVLYNSDAPIWKDSKTNKCLPRNNFGGYVGFIVGDVCKKCDWSIDINYQYIEAFVIPSQDASGIGRNGSNLLNDTVTANGRGFTNYKGWHFEGLYAVTDNLSIDLIYEFSHQITPNIPGNVVTATLPNGAVAILPVNRHSYQKFELEVIYAF